MSVERERRALQLLDELLEQPADDRVAFLDEHCDDPEVRRRVEELLRDETGSDGFGSPVFDVHEEDPAVGRRIGDYRLVELLGRGGMGAVYLAEREDFDQRVALKLIRRGLDADPQLIRRFHNERQILARLDHRYIARLLDGGTTDDHLPYFVMEHVEGEPIHRYCRNQGLGIADRLRLFRKVCAAVQSAHRSLVVHRDLKPGNVLITAKGEPKLLDFGIAKLLDDELAARPLATIPGQGPMTPRYASPEQIRLEPITTASDVYSLGVLLFELLTGQSPYDTPDDSAATVGKAVCEQEPLAPSTAVRRRASEDPALPPADTLRKRLSGDLDSIVLKALQKRPEDRYSSVEALADDLKRHLAGHPVSAREGTWLYRLGKGIRRHRLAVAVVTAFVLLSLSFGVVSYRLGQRAEAARILAELQRDRSEAKTEFLKSLFDETDPDTAEGLDLSAIELLRRGEDNLDGLDDLGTEIELSGIMAKFFERQGAYEDAARLAERALDAARRLHGEVHPEVARRLSNLAYMHGKNRDYQQAEASYRETLALREELRQGAVQLLKTRSGLASALTGQARYAEAETILREVLAERLRLYGKDDLDVARSRRSLGACLYALGDLDEAEVHLQEALRVRAMLSGPLHTDVATALDVLCEVKTAQEELREAMKLCARALDIRVDRLREDHPDLAESRMNLAIVLVTIDSAKAERLLRVAYSSLAGRESEAAKLAEVESARGALLTHLGRFEEAERILREAYKELVRLRSKDALPTRVTDQRLIDLYQKWGRPDPGRPASPTDDPPAPETNP